MKILKKNLLIQYVIQGKLFASEDHLIWASEDQGQTWNEVCQLAAPYVGLFARLKNKMLRSQIVRRFRKNIGINNIVVLPTGTIIAQYDKIYRYDGNGNYALPVFDLEQQKVAGPLKNGLCYDEATDALYFGEYICERPNSIRIFRGTNDGRNWEVCYTFPEAVIRHVHSVIADQFRQRIWVCTGDSDQESGLYYTDDGFVSLNLLSGGDQSWRMVSLIPTEDHIYWGSDAGGDAPPGTTNYIYRFDLNNNTRERLTEVGNPVYFSIKTPEGFFMSTTFEPHKIGSFKKESELWFSLDGSKWDSICQFPYKLQPNRFSTAYGMTILPNGDMDNLVFSPVNTVCNHFQVLTLDKVN